MVNPLLVGQTNEVIESWKECINNETQLCYIDEQCYNPEAAETLQSLREQFVLALNRDVDTEGAKGAVWSIKQTMKWYPVNGLGLYSDVKNFVKQIAPGRGNMSGQLAIMNQAIEGRIKEQKLQIWLKGTIERYWRKDR
ncbi:hypothetical protein [Candidatus Tisiphia endosymbiont of Nemotelus uliginosus]|uniref:hypothetical protein n=1 Tax=Candidatus Tisiphia endosymbiont of Nemotelus uliginosus TaxID=3077926 RepID=UPI0035C926C3